jgi:hypothetical protein
MAGARDLSVPIHVQNGLGPTLLLTEYQSSLPGIKRAGREAYLSSPRNIAVGMCRAVSLSLCGLRAFMAWTGTFSHFLKLRLWYGYS